MARTPLRLFIAAGLLLSVVTPVLGQAPVLRSANHDYRVVKVADGLINPWSMAFPVIGYGVNYRTGSAIHEGTLRDGIEAPTHFWVPSIATSGLMIYTGNVFPAWKGSIFAGGLGGQQIARLTMNGQRVVREETLLQGMGRVRDIRQSPDGYIYVAIESRDGLPTAVVRLEPAGAR